MEHEIEYINTYRAAKHVMWVLRLMVRCSRRRKLFCFGLVMLMMELCFFWAAHNHIRKNDAGKSLAQTQRERKQGRSPSTYRPDYSVFNVSLPILYASSPGLLRSIPVSYQVPSHVFESGNYSSHYEGWDHQKDKPPLFVYNPSIVAISSDSDSQQDHNSNSPSLPQYLALFRVSSIHSCGFPTIEFWKHPTDFLGIGLLDENLLLVEDLVVDINQHLPRIYGSKIKLQDVRVFRIHGRIYFSSGIFLIPICIETGTLDNRRSLDFVKCEDGGSKTEVPALFGPNRMLRLFVSGDAVKLQNVNGKNFQFYESPSGSILFEYWPHKPRVVFEINGEEFDRSYHMGRGRGMRLATFGEMQEFKSDHTPSPRSKVASALDASLKTFIKQDRGSACCLEISHKYYKDLISPTIRPELSKRGSIFVGIAHSKSRHRMESTQGDRYNYLSRLYAVSTNEPYELLARSGLFCLGFSDKTDVAAIIGAAENYGNLTKRKQLELNGHTYNCPNIHFVDSLIGKAKDDSRAIISYGVNDCLPRFIEVSKQDLVRHLFLE